MASNDFGLSNTYTTYVVYNVTNFIIYVLICSTKQRLAFCRCVSEEAVMHEICGNSMQLLRKRHPIFRGCTLP